MINRIIIKNKMLIHFTTKEAGTQNPRSARSDSYVSMVWPHCINKINSIIILYCLIRLQCSASSPFLYHWFFITHWFWWLDTNWLFVIQPYKWEVILYEYIYVCWIGSDWKRAVSISTHSTLSMVHNKVEIRIKD